MIFIGYIYQKETRKDTDNMSFVGLHITKTGVIAFADSKASISYHNKETHEDTNRKNLQKIFANQEFIMVTWGNNEVFSPKNRTNIEDYINKTLSEHISLTDFFMAFYRAIYIDKATYNNGIYNFLVSSKDSYGYYCSKLTLNVNAPTLEEGLQQLRQQLLVRHYDYGGWFAGDKWFVGVYEQYPKYYDIPVEEYANKVKVSLTKLVESYEAVFGGYNSVGLPIRVKIFQ